MSRCSKRRYKSENDPKALKHIRDLKKRGYDNLHVYECDQCPPGIYHVGHLPGSPKKIDFLFKKDGLKNA